MTTKEMVAQIEEARGAFVEYITTTYNGKIDPWSEVEMYKIAGFLDCSCERIIRLDTLLKNK